MYYEIPNKYSCDLCGNLTDDGVTIIWIVDGEDESKKEIVHVQNHLTPEGSDDYPDPGHVCQSCHKAIRDIGRVH